MATKSRATAQANTRAATAPSRPAANAAGVSSVAPAGARIGQGQARRPEAPRSRGVRVRATKVCYYDDKRRRVGDVFTISDEKNKTGGLKEFSSKYMELVDPRTPEKITTGAEVLKQQHDDILGSRAADADPNFAPRALGTGDESAIEDEDEDR